MKIIVITGDRTWGEDRYDDVLGCLRWANAIQDSVLVVLGDAEGADFLARRACEFLGLDYVREEAHWRGLGRAAGPERNGRMLNHVQDPHYDEVWYFHDNLRSSKGTKNCCRQAIDRGITVRSWRHVLRYGLS